MTRALTVLTALTVLAAAPAHAGRLHPDDAAPATVHTDVRERPTVRVSRGQSLSTIADEHDVPGGWRRLAYLNRDEVMPDPDLIEVGTRLTIPLRDGKQIAWTPPSLAPSSPASASSDSAPASATSSPGNGSVWHRLAACESGGNWSANTGNGYYGGLQFLPSTWRSVGGTGLPHQHSAAEQIKRGQILQARAGWGQWPACSAKLGLR